MPILQQSFISGKIDQPEQATMHQRAENLSFSSAQYVHRNTYSEKIYSLKKIYFVSRYWNTISSHGLDPVNCNMLRSRTIILYDGENNKFHMTNHRQRAKGICRCFISSPSESYNRFKLVKLKNISTSNSQTLQPRVSSEGASEMNMSIAILPMSKEFNWNSATVGLIQSSFFWGYLLTQGVAMPAMNNILSKWIPVSERSRSLAMVYSGMYLGSVIGLAVSPILIQKFAWPSVFYSFGSLGSLHGHLCFTHLVPLEKKVSSPIEDPELSAEEKDYILGGSISKEPVTAIPWKLILSKAPVWALIVSHFCHNWGTFILLTWMPTYYNQVLKFNLTKSGLLCVLPWLTMAVFANIGGWIADTLVSRGLSVTTVRKIMQSIGFLGPAFFLTQLSHVKTPAMAVLCMACSQGSDAFSQSGLYSNHQDIGPCYAGVLLGLSNTAGVLAGVFGTAATGYILQNEDQEYRSQFRERWYYDDDDDNEQEEEIENRNEEDTENRNEEDTKNPNEE
ncbi:hypothetical protein L1987_76910 [Smallanthus sonchifolius]|uniref:Uncharacterized protein n=1 Tax=Smallanthus sonchifolius TaxID=185202 RepID=A0ACB8Z9K0_9ASTR|nr:hypothetical protein L1987_76910 [Smallanthus sonchifolius]